MAKRVQEQKEEEKIVAKSRPTAMNLSSSVPASSSSTKNMIPSSDLETIVAAVKLAIRTRRNSKPDAASSSQVKLKDVFLGGLMDEVAVKPAATDQSQESSEFSESESKSNHEEELTGKLVASKNSEKSVNFEAGSRN